MDNDLAERAFFFELLKKPSSPYINRFLSADTIVPGYANPQNLNRYSYVRNNPVKYIDPTGHGVDCGIGMGCVTPYVPPTAGNHSGGGGNGGGGEENNQDNGGSCDTNSNGVADIPCPSLTTRDWEDGFDRLGSPDICPVTSLIECYYLHASLNMGQDPLNIDLEEFQALLLAIYYEVNGRHSPDLVLTSMGFDTPFYDHGVLGGLGALPGTACIDSLGCYAWHEINYIAQGEIAAAAGESRTAGLFRVHEWKLVFGLEDEPSPGTITMWNIGYIFYHAQNGSTAP